MTSGLISSLLAGFFGASAGVATKVAFDADLVRVGFSRWTSWSGLGNIGDPSDTIIYGLQFVFVLVMLLCNICMFKCFNRALQQCSTSIEASLITTSANLFVTACCGSLFFSEVLSGSWWIGTVFILSGICMIGWDQEDKKKSQ